MWSKLKLWLQKCDHCQNYGYTIVIIIKNVATQIWSKLKIWQQNHIEDGGEKQQCNLLPPSVNLHAFKGVWTPIQ